MSLLIVAVTAAASAQSPEPACPSSAEALQGSLTEVLAAWNALDQDAYKLRRDDVFTRLDCLAEVLPPATAADVHIVLALDAFRARQDDVLAGALRAYAHSRPDAPLADRVKLPGPLQAANDAALAAPGAAEQPLPEEVSFWVDGAASETWPADRTAILQAHALDDSDRVWTDRLPVGGPLPPIPAWVQPVPKDEVQRKKRAGLWWTATGATALATGGLWWAALQERAAFQAYEDTVARSGPLAPGQRQEVEATADRANSLGIAAQALSGLTAGLTTVSLVVTF